MFRSPILRNEQFQFDFENNPYKAKKVWPPDFSKLSPKYQFRLEKRYRRRAKLAWARPRWTKFTKLAQYGLSISLIGYLVLFHDFNQEDPEKQPFQSIRRWYNSLADSIWTTTAGPLDRNHLHRKET